MKAATLILGLLLATAAHAGTLACLGDSNTSTRWPFAVAPRTSWCDAFAQAYPTWTVHNFAVYGASLASMSGMPADGAPEQLQAALTAADGLPTVIVMAFGTNDARAVDFDADAVTNEYQAYVDIGARLGITVLIATTPPGFAPFLTSTLAARFRAENTALRQKYRGALIDFTHGFSARDMLADGVHFNDVGEAIRLRRVVLALKQRRGLL